jgi:hypothetical protein
MPDYDEDSIFDEAPRVTVSHNFVTFQAKASMGVHNGWASGNRVFECKVIHR